MIPRAGLVRAYTPYGRYLHAVYPPTSFRGVRAPCRRVPDWHDFILPGGLRWDADRAARLPPCPSCRKYGLS